MNIVLTGFMGTGKSSVGRILAEKLKFGFIDTDELIEKETGMKISAIFSEKGEQYFRGLETDVVRKAGALDRQVISTGGGVVLRSENMDYLKAHGLIINLSADPDAIYERTKANNDRPLLQKPDPKAEIRKLLESREPFYKDCNFRINTGRISPDETAETCLKYIEKKLPKS